MTCPICGKKFQFLKRNLSTHPNPCCSRKCGGIKSREKFKKKLNKEIALRDTREKMLRKWQRTNGERGKRSVTLSSFGGSNPPLSTNTLIIFAK